MRYLVFVVASLIASCGDVSDNTAFNNGTLNGNRSDSIRVNYHKYREEQDHLARKRALCMELGLYDIQQQTVPFELRM